MTIYDEEQVLRLCESSRTAAIRALTKIRIFCGTEPSFSGLGGWVFEQTVQYCLRKELNARRAQVATIAEQGKVGSRIRADLLVGRAAVEIKQSGLYSSSAIAKYGQYRRAANAQGLEYLFITGGERYQPYRDGITKALGKENVFFLDQNGDWKRFVARVIQLGQ